MQALRDICAEKIMAGDNSTRVGLGSQPEPAPNPPMATMDLAKPVQASFHHHPRCTCMICKKG
jgi:hypothetical protein